VSLKVEPFKTKKEVSIHSRGKSDTQTLHNHNIKCLWCLGIVHIAF